MSKTLEETTKEIARVALLLGDVPGVMWSALAALERYPAHEYEARTLAQSRDTLLAGLRSLRILALAPAPAPSTTRAPAAHVYGPGCTGGRCGICGTWHCMSHLAPDLSRLTDCPGPTTTRAPGGEPCTWDLSRVCPTPPGPVDCEKECPLDPSPASPVLPEERGTGAEVVEVVGRDVIALPSMCGDGGAEALSTSCAWDPTVECPVPPTRVVDCYKECPFPSIPGFAPAAPETPATGPKETP